MAKSTVPTPSTTHKVTEERPDNGTQRPHRRIGVIHHEKKQLGGGVERLRAWLADAGHRDPLWRDVRKAKQAPSALRKLMADGADHILIWGGDGTIRRCINTLVNDGLHPTVSLAMIPAGTANLLARNLGIPDDLAGAVDIALNGNPEPTDIGLMNDRYFAVAAGIGFDALMMRSVDQDDLKTRFGPWAHLVAGLRNMSLPPAEFRIRVDGDVWFQGDACSVIVGNVGSLLGGIELFPDAEVDDSFLHVAVVRAEGGLDWARLAGRALVGDVSQSPLIATHRGRDIDISVDRSLPWEVDGSDRKRKRTFNARILPGAIRIARPAPGAANADFIPVLPPPPSLSVGRTFGLI